MKILDSSPVIAFYTELNEPDMLHKFIELGYELRIPRSVFKEIENGRTSEPLKSNIAHGNIEILASVKSTLKCRIIRCINSVFGYIIGLT